MKYHEITELEIIKRIKQLLIEIEKLKFKCFKDNKQ